jgi:hypothetical protein
MPAHRMTERTCPLGHTCDACLWYTQLRGKNPQTGAEMDEHGCAVAWLPVLLVENSQQQRQTAASVDSFREATLKGNDNLGRLLLDYMQ